MLKKIGLKNIRSFKNLKDFEFKPITVLCGTNSSGKSTILKSLLLWKQTLENLAYNKGFLLNGKYTNLGSQDNLLYNKAKNKLIKFNFQFEYEKQPLLTRGKVEDLDFLRHEAYSLINRAISKKTLDSADLIKINFTLEYMINVNNKLEIDIKNYILKITPVENISKESPPRKELNLSEDGIKETVNEMELKISSIGGDKIKLEWENISFGQSVKANSVSAARLYDRIQKLKKGSYTFPVDYLFFENILNLSLGIHEGLIDFDDDADELTLRKIIEITDGVRILLTSYFDDISYLGPLREEPARRYIFDDQVNDIGVKGENSAFLFNYFKTKNVSYFAYDPTKEEFVEKEETLENAAREWLDEIGILGFGSEKSEELYRFSLRSSEFSENKVNIADVGFGVSQVVPIVIQGLLMNLGGTLILEQPEIHLHPKMQMKLADFTLSMALSGKNVILETHSEHVINRFVRRIVEDKSGELNSLIGINFIKNSADGSIIEKVNLSETNGMLNWPDEFFDQAAGEQQKIMNAIINKKMKNKK